MQLQTQISQCQCFTQNVVWKWKIIKKYPISRRLKYWSRSLSNKPPTKELLPRMSCVVINSCQRRLALVVNMRRVTRWNFTTNMPQYHACGCRNTTMRIKYLLFRLPVNRPEVKQLIHNSKRAGLGFGLGRYFTLWSNHKNYHLEPPNVFSYMF